MGDGFSFHTFLMLSRAMTQVRDEEARLRFWVGGRAQAARCVCAVVCVRGRRGANIKTRASAVRWQGC